MQVCCARDGAVESSFCLTRLAHLFGRERESATDGIGRDVIVASRHCGNGRALKFRTCGLGSRDTTKAYNTDILVYRFKVANCFV